MKNLLSILMILVGILASLASALPRMIGGTSIGIIGGADGPTSILIAGDVGSHWWLGLLVGIVAILCGVFLLAKD